MNGKSRYQRRVEEACRAMGRDPDQVDFELVKSLREARHTNGLEVSETEEELRDRIDVVIQENERNKRLN